LPHTTDDRSHHSVSTQRGILVAVWYADLPLGGAHHVCHREFVQRRDSAASPLRDIWFYRLRDI
jgi:hypothetical protein